MSNWFTADKTGLSNLQARRPPGWRIGETLQNPWDEDGVREVAVVLQASEDPNLSILICVDDSPTGFRDLSHAYTLFAESYKTDDAEKRGRFNLGEKLVLATAVEARITSTTGTIHFNDEGRSEDPDHKRNTGTEFYAVIHMTADEREEELQAVRRFVPPEGIVTRINGATLDRPTAKTSFQTTLDTLVAREGGVMKPTRRKTTVTIYEPHDGIGWILEMGIPICETGDRWSYDVGQKVPQNMERATVGGAYLRRLRAEAVNHLHTLLEDDDVAETWVTEAAGSQDISEEAFNSVLDKKYGEKRFLFDTSDMEANNKAIAAGWTPVYGNHLPKGIRDNRKNFRDNGRDPITPAGKMERFATHKETFWDFKPMLPVEMTPEVQAVVNYAKHISDLLVPRKVTIEVINDPNGEQLADYQQTSGRMRLNIGTLGKRWFKINNLTKLQAVDDLVIHELGHHFEGNHLSKRFNDALTLLGAKLTRLVREGKIDHTPFFPKVA